MTADDVVYTVEALKSPDASGADGGRLGRRHRDGRSTRRTVELKVDTPIAGFLAGGDAAAAAGAPPRRTCPFADLADQLVRARRRSGPGPTRSRELDDTHAVLLPTALVDAPVGVPPDAVAVDGLAGHAVRRRSTPALPVPYLEQIEVNFYEDEAAAAAAFAAGEVDARRRAAARRLRGPGRRGAGVDGCGTRRPRWRR